MFFIRDNPKVGSICSNFTLNESWIRVWYISWIIPLMLIQGGSHIRKKGSQNIVRKQAVNLGIIFLSLYLWLFLKGNHFLLK